MSNDFRTSSTLNDYLLKQGRLEFQCSITADATPADKVLASDIPGVAVLRCEGLTAAADAIENLTAQVEAPVDATGKFSILIDDATVLKFNTATVTASTGTVAVTKIVSTGGRLVLQCDSNQDLSSQSITLTVSVGYQKR